MIKEFILENCGPLEKIEWQPSPYINLVIGENSSGKSVLLKMLYTALRATEEYHRGDDRSNFIEILSDKLHGVFQIDKVGDLVRKGSGRLTFECLIDSQKVQFSFSPSAVQNVGEVSKIINSRADKLSLFLPPKEVLSLTSIIRRSRLQDQLLGFDDTYLDLVNALDGEPTKGRVHTNIKDARDKLSDLIDGRLQQSNGSWKFREGNAQYSIHMTAEGIKRLALIDRLIGNRSLQPGSALFIDEPEAMLHPKAIVEFMEILTLLTGQQIQIFMASHSYFVLKALYVIAKRERLNIQVLSLFSDIKPQISNLAEEMPDNPIIDESINLYEKELDAELA
ncbi:MAG: ATP-binding protein [Chloroflexota bacterium]